MPAEFAATTGLREWFVAGVADALDDMPEPQEHGFRAEHEPGAWNAYNGGYHAGQSWKRRGQVWPQ